MHDGLNGGNCRVLLMVLWQPVGVEQGTRTRDSSSPRPDITQAVQQTLDAVVERLLLLNMVVEHLAKAGAGGVVRVFKNARFLNTSRRRTLARAGGLMPMTLLPVTYGYARVSKSDDAARNLETQLRLLADHGIRADLIFSDIATGRTLRRAGWQELLSRLRPGDTLVVAFLDRLSRNFEDGVRIQADLTERNIGIVALRENIDTSDGSAAAKFFRRSMLAQGAYQVDSTSERIKLGLDQARAGGRRLGRSPALTPEQVAQCRRMTEEGAGLRHIARVMQCSPATVKKALALMPFSNTTSPMALSCPRSFLSRKSFREQIGNSSGHSQLFPL